jgi:hypothetical protein
MLYSVRKNPGKRTTLTGLPSTVFKGQLLKTNFMLEYVHVTTKLGNCIPWQIQVEGQLAHLVVDETSNSFDLHDISICGSDLHHEVVRLAVMLVGGMQIPFKLIQKAGFELMPHKEI